MIRTVSQKMGIKDGMRALLVQAPDDAVAAMALPDIQRTTRMSGLFDYIHLFVTTQTEFEKRFPKLKAHLKPGGMLWASWPKNKQLNTDLTLPHVIRIGYNYGLVESTSLRVDDTWSALKFTHPKKGKVYNNHYGKLPEQL